MAPRQESITKFIKNTNCVCVCVPDMFNLEENLIICVEYIVTTLRRDNSSNKDLLV